MLKRYIKTMDVWRPDLVNAHRRNSAWTEVTSTYDDAMDVYWEFQTPWNGVHGFRPDWALLLLGRTWDESDED